MEDIAVQRIVVVVGLVCMILGFGAGYFVPRPAEVVQPDCVEVTNLTSQLNACVNATNQLLDPVVMTDGYGHFACCSKVGRCQSVPGFILNNTLNDTGED